MWDGFLTGLHYHHAPCLARPSHPAPCPAHRHVLPRHFTLPTSPPQPLPSLPTVVPFTIAAPAQRPSRPGAALLAPTLGALRPIHAVPGAALSSGGRDTARHTLTHLPCIIPRMVPHVPPPRSRRYQRRCTSSPSPPSLVTNAHHHYPRPPELCMPAGVHMLPTSKSSCSPNTHLRQPPALAILQPLVSPPRTSTGYAHRARFAHVSRAHHCTQAGVARHARAAWPPNTNQHQPPHQTQVLAPLDLASPAPSHGEGELSGVLDVAGVPRCRATRSERGRRRCVPQHRVLRCSTHLQRHHRTQPQLPKCYFCHPSSLLKGLPPSSHPLAPQ